MRAADLSERHWLRKLREGRAGRPVNVLSVVAGKPATPTPLGLFAISERIRQPAGSVLGPWALHLTSHPAVGESRARRMSLR